MLTTGESEPEQLPSPFLFSLDFLGSELAMLRFYSSEITAGDLKGTIWDAGYEILFT